MALAVLYTRQGDTRWATRLLLITAVLGFVFLALKGYEYYLDYRDGTVPGAGFHFQGAERGPALLFWLFYFYATANGGGRHTFSQDYGTHNDVIKGTKSP